jgi:ABC-type branched-subunit amino acid transport system substrate-binding protein
LNYDQLILGCLGVINMKKIISLYLLIAVLFGCNDNNTDNPESKKIKISAILDLSGHYSQFGIESRQAIELMQSLNGNLEISYYDSKGLSATADSLLNLIISYNEKPVIVTLASWISNDLADKIADNSMLQIAIGSAAFNKSDLQSSIKMTEGVEDENDYLISKLNSFNKIAIMYFNNDYGMSWNSTLSNSLGEKIVATESYIDSQTDFTKELSRIVQYDPEVIVLISTREAAMIVKQARSLGINSQLYGTRPILTNELLSEPASEGLIFSYPQINFQNPIVEKFQMNFGYKPGSFAAESIDLCGLLINAAESGKYSRDEVLQFVKYSSFTGAFNSIYFDDYCRADYNFKLMRVHNGSFEEIE